MIFNYRRQDGVTVKIKAEVDMHHGYVKFEYEGEKYVVNYTHYPENVVKARTYGVPDDCDATIQDIYPVMEHTLLVEVDGNTYEVLKPSEALTQEALRHAFEDARDTLERY